MCKAFSALITKSKKVYWQTGIDSHDELQTKFVKKDKELKDEVMPPKNTFARIEIVPKDGNYLNLKQKWVYGIDEEVKPEWLNKSYEKPCFVAFEKWKKEVYSQFNLKEVLHPVYPFKIRPPKNITTRHLRLLAKWASVWDSVRASVRASVWASVWASVGDSVGASVWDSVRASVGDSVRASVRDSVRASVGDSVWDSVRASVGDSVWAYIGSFFPSIKKWQYVNTKKLGKGYPFASAVKLWKLGLVPSYDIYNKIWRLHAGKKAKVVWEGTKADLNKYIK
jgi:hypothetical protein